MPAHALLPLRPALALVAVVAGVACSRRPAPPQGLSPAAPPPSLTPARPTPTPTVPPEALTLLRRALERDEVRLRVRLPRAAGITWQPGPTPGTWAFRCRCYAYVPASTLPWVFEASGTLDTRDPQVRLTALVPPAELPVNLLPSPVAVQAPEEPLADLTPGH